MPVDEPDSLRLDLHIHTEVSRDALITLDDVCRWVERRGLDGVAITDHNHIDNALALAERAPFRVIIGEEIRTTRGEMIGLFLEEWIPPDLSPRETLARIHDQGAIAYVPHPLDRSRNSAMGEDTLLEVIDAVDAIEGLNARTTYQDDNERALAIARDHGIPVGAGSDAHLPFEIGQAYVEMPGFDDGTAFQRALPQATLHGSLSSPLVHLGSTVAKLRHRLRADAITHASARKPHE